jgi:hypothetical protein
MQWKDPLLEARNRESMMKLSRDGKFLHENRMILQAALKSHADSMDSHLMGMSMGIPEGRTQEQADALYEHYRGIGEKCRAAAAFLEEHYPWTMADRLEMLSTFEKIFAPNTGENQKEEGSA